MIDAYRALALQTTCRAINSCSTPEDAATAVADNIVRVGRQIRASKAFIGADLKLVVLPEYFATSYPLGDTIPGWAAKGCFAMDGAEYEQLGRIAQDNGVYLCSNAYERDPNFPELYFQSSVILDDSGNQILRYRRLISLYAPSPHDVWDKYLDIYGVDGVFPVARTPIGRLSCIASEEILYPEVARAMGVRGAEVFLHSTSEVGSPELTPKDIAKRARALENMAYVVSANTAGISGVDIPLGSADGMSKIVDDQGRVLSAAGTGESMAAYADLDIAGLRRRRLRPGMGNFLSRLPQAAINAGLASTALKPNALMDGETLKIPQRADFAARQKATLDALLSAGVLGND
ncbi:nitrilase-related carbon-nitrogen hydrolase [Stenotrophomonas sp.]|uniref:nitrilase-related carbon-nitrogen hydrolase n=1 Tax=Stenotrophomonas sp. TaxID=69392 RepID=UPI0028A7A3C2|nr:nitrilase-related carbon-nitrogen hydrolase [Stenotrophomonas sp.]